MQAAVRRNLTPQLVGEATLLRAKLITAINVSEQQPGVPVKGRLVEGVGELPAGTEFRGKVVSVRMGQNSRVFVDVNLFIKPDGQKIAASHCQLADPDGSVGVSGTVQAARLSLIDDAGPRLMSELGEEARRAQQTTTTNGFFASNTSTLPDLGQRLVGSAISSLGQAAGQATSKSSAVRFGQPSLSVAQNTEVVVFLENGL